MELATAKFKKVLQTRHRIKTKLLQGTSKRKQTRNVFVFMENKTLLEWVGGSSEALLKCLVGFILKRIYIQIYITYIYPDMVHLSAGTGWSEGAFTLTSLRLI